ncbi:hypothetical protein JCM8097_007609 [Rhodosporidiobolus ruineniae]
MFRSAQAFARAARPAVSPRALQATALRRSSPATFFARPYSAAPSPDATAEAKDAPAADAKEPDSKVADLEKQLEESKKLAAELKDARLRTLADYENLQKISAREKQQAKDFALQKFAKDLISEIDILNLALRSIPADRLVATAEPAFTPNSDLVGLHEGVNLTKRGIEKVLNRYGVVGFDPTGEQFDPNMHEALYQAPVPGKEPGSVLECQEIGYTINGRLLRPAKVGVVLSQE